MFCGGVLIELPSNLDLLDDISFVKLGLLVEMIFDLPPTLYIPFLGMHQFGLAFLLRRFSTSIFGGTSAQLKIKIKLMLLLYYRL
ncbi:unnamed protein product [Camellia sinensis]